MKTDDYKIDYYSEMISCGFEEAGCYENWASLTKEQKESIIEGLLVSIENQSMAFGYVDTRRCDSHEVASLKRQLKEAQKDSQEWQDAFTKNVSRRRGWEKHEIAIGKDGSATCR